MTDRERFIAVERLRDNRTGIKSTKFKWSQVREAFLDPQCWMLALWAGISQITAIGGSFLPLLIQGMGFTGLNTTLLSMPLAGMQVISMAIAGTCTIYVYNGRTIFMFILACPTLAGIVMLAVLKSTDIWARVVSTWLLGCVPASFAISLSLISSNVAGFTKKITTTFMSFVLFCVGYVTFGS